MARRCSIWFVNSTPLKGERFRISSIEPNLLTDEIIDFVSTSAKFQPHFHIPLQSGSDDVVRNAPPLPHSIVRKPHPTHS